jgi:hypothetical protein
MDISGNPGAKEEKLRTDLAVPHPAGQKEDHDDPDDDECDPEHFRAWLKAES